MTDTAPESGNPASEGQAKSKQKPSESEAAPLRLEAWAVRPSELHPGYIEARFEARDGTVLYVYLDPISGYDLSDKLLSVVAEVKNSPR